MRASAVDSLHDRRARFATSTVFLALGMSTGAWGSRLPAMKDQAALSDGELGLALLAAPIGVVVAMHFFVAPLIHRFGSGRTTRWATLLMFTVFPLPAFAHELMPFAIALLFVGMSCGLLDSAMNTHASVLEHRYARPIMSGIHAYFSLGALAGAVTGGLAAHLAWPPLLHCTVLSVVVLLALSRFLFWLLPSSADEEAQSAQTSEDDASTRWNRPMLALGAIIFCAYLGEGAAYDWSSVHLRDSLGASAGIAAFTVAAFSLSMCAFRFLGDGLIARLGSVRALRYGGTVSGVGLGTALTVQSVPFGLIGWAIFGAGLAIVAPTSFAAAGNLPGISRAKGIARVAGIGWTGVLLGPAIIGGLAEFAGLTLALAVTALLALCITALAPAACASQPMPPERESGAHNVDPSTQERDERKTSRF